MVFADVRTTALYCSWTHRTTRGVPGTIDRGHRSMNHTPMKRRRVPPALQPFLDQVRHAEERLFPAELHEDRSFMGSGERRFWHFRPSHHASTGLVTADDLALLSLPDTRLLSVGAFPAYLERTLVELGVPADHLLLADREVPSEGWGAVTWMLFDATEQWPEMGTFDRILFPESLCTMVGDRLRAQGVPSAKEDRARADAAEAEVLTRVLRASLSRLRPGGVLRANGPMSHPVVLRRAEEMLAQEGWRFTLQHSRFFLSLQVPDASQAGAMGPGRARPS